MKKKINRWVFNSFLIHLLMGSVFGSQAHANLLIGGNASSYVSCDDFCAQFGGGGFSGNASGLSIPTGLTATPTPIPVFPPSTPWSSSDDAFCALIGTPTNRGFMLTAHTHPSPSPTASSCSIDLSVFPPGMFGNDPQSCAIAGNLWTHCSYHNSQVEKQCMAYNSIDTSGARTFDTVLLAMDYTVAAMCASACIALASGIGAAVGDNLATVCSVLSLGEGALELASSLVMTQQMPLGKYLASQNNQSTGFNYAEAGLGAGGVALGAAGGILRLTGTTVKATTEAAEQAAKEAAKKAATKAEKVAKSQKYLACATAALFTAMAAVRTVDLVAMQHLKDDACNNIQDLLSKTLPIDPDGNPITPQNPIASLLSGGSNTALKTSIAGMSPQQKSGYISCMGTLNNAASCVKQVTGNDLSTAVDGGLLSKLPGRAMAQFPTLSQMDQIAQKAMKDGPGGVMASMLGSAATQGFGADFVDIAKNAADKSAELKGIFGMQSSSTHSTYQGGGTVAAIDTSQNLGGSNSLGTGIFAGLSGGSGPQTPSVLTFQEQPEDTDIWHAQASVTLFQIVSKKITHVSGRLRTFKKMENN